MADQGESKIVAGMRDAVAFARGDKEAARVFQVRVPDEIDVREIRKRVGMTQQEFALQFGFNLGTLKGWEQKRRTPSGSDRVFLSLIGKAPDKVKELLAA